MSPFVLVHSSSSSSRIESKLIKSSHLKKLAIGRASRIAQAGPKRGNHKPIMATTPTTLASPPVTRAISSSLRMIGLVILLLAIIHLDGRQSIVRCQDFEDLNNNNKHAANHVNNNNGGANQQQAAFQPSRQSSSSTSNSPSQGASNSRQSFQRPVLSNRFAQQQLSAQASTISNTVVSGQQQQQTLPTTTSQQQQATSQPAPSNIEQIMKNALARTNRFEQAGGGDAAESRQDQNSEPIQSRSGAQFQSTSSSSPSRTTPAASAANTASAAVDSSEGQTNTQAADEQDKQTTAAAQAGATNGHDTVYSDQRFANLFARRGNQKKTKFTPTEQVRAKPTLPSFIKSPPDPKQFSASSVDSQDRQITQASANLISVRLQQQQSNQNRQSVSSQKKPIAAITSNTAANANNKRLNSQKQQTTAASVSPKASSGSRANGSQANANVTNRPASNNPFNKPQQNSNDPANVIAMARRRLLANNANNQQQQQRPVAN